MLENNKNAVTVIYSGGDIQVPFLFYDQDDLVVLVETTPQKAGQDYTVSGAGNTTGGKVAFVKAPADGDRVTVIRKVDFTQLLSIPPNGIIPEGALTKALDRIVMMVQQLAEQAGRAVTYPEGTEKSEVANAGEMIDKIDDAQVRIVEAAALASDVVEQANDVLASTQQAKKDAELLLAQAGLPDLNAGDEGKGLVVKEGGAGYEVGGTAASFDVGEAPENLPTNERMQGLVDDVVLRTYAGGVRNTILSGRVKEGQPAHLVHPEFINMEHDNNVLHSKVGTVSCSARYDGTYSETRPLRNQVVWENYCYHTPNGQGTGWWQYDFTKARVLVGLFVMPNDNSHTNCLRNWQLQGWDGASWVDIVSFTDDMKQRGYNNNLRSHGRMYWFTEHTAAYEKVRINFTAWEGNRISITALRFYEAVVSAQHQNDVSLFASAKEPFQASIAMGYDDNVAPVDCHIKLTEPVTMDGRKFAEFSKNIMYLVPPKKEGGLPDGLNPQKATALPDGKGYLLVDHRKIHYGSIEDIEKECLGLVQSRHIVDDDLIDVTGEHELGYYAARLYTSSLGVSTTEKPRGAVSSYHFANGNRYIHTNPDLANQFKNKNFHPYGDEFTVEIDFKSNNPSPEAADSYHMIFDSGYNSSKGVNVRYYNRQKHIVVAINQAQFYTVPFDASDGTWHTLAISKLEEQLHVHIDGKNICSFTEVQPAKQYYRSWMLGRWIHTSGYNWSGFLNNFRYTVGTALYCGEDYEVTPVFHTGLIPDKTLWYDSAEGVVKEYNAATDVWKKQPMLPLGEVVTESREHLLSDQPRGTHHNVDTKEIVEYESSGQYDGNHISKGLFNFGHGGEYVYATPNNNHTTDHFAGFTLREPKAFDRLKLFCTTWDWRAKPVHFVLTGSNDKENWTTLYSKLSNDHGAGMLHASAKSNGNSHRMQGYFTFEYDNTTPFKHYRIELPKKDTIPFYKDYAHTAVLAEFSFRDSAPDVYAVSSYIHGETYSVSQIPIVTNTEYKFPVPMGAMPFEVTGFVQEESDFTSKKRLLGQGHTAESGGAWVGRGETVYVKEGQVIVMTGSSELSIYTGGYHNSPEVAASSTRAMLSLKCKRLV